MPGIHRSDLTAVSSYITMLVALVVAVWLFGSMITTGSTKVIHVHGHTCIVRGTIFNQAMSCDWGKP